MLLLPAGGQAVRDDGKGDIIKEGEGDEKPALESLQLRVQGFRAHPIVAPPRFHFLVMERRAELSPCEMGAILAHRVSVLYSMSVEEYTAARKAETLPGRPGDTALAVFSGEAGAPSQKTGGAT